MESFTAAEVAELDRYTIEDLGVDVKQLMEMAGLRSAEKMAAMVPEKSHITVLVGSGGNGGDALVAAKWLKLWGYNPEVILSHPLEKLKPVTSDQLKVWENFGGVVIDNIPSQTTAIIDGLLGYSLQGAPRGRTAELINQANKIDVPKLALDVSSGLNATSGQVYDPCFKASKTVVFGVMKKGLDLESAKKYTGEIEVVDIGFPRSFLP